MRTLTKFLLDIPEPLMDEIILSGGLKLYQDTSYNAEWKVTASAFAKVIPASVKGVSENDEVAISYFIVADRYLSNYDDNYFPVTEGNDFLEKYKNSKGFWLTKAHIPNPINKWMCVLQDNKMDWVDGVEGTQGQVENWMMQFHFGSNDYFTYTNLVQIGDKQYWKAEDFNIFAKKVGDEIIAISDRVICKPVAVDLTTLYNIQNGTILPPFSVVGMYTDRGEIISGGENLGLNKGDIIGFETKFCERYTLWGLECFLIKYDRIDVTWQSESNLKTNKIIQNGN